MLKKNDIITTEIIDYSSDGNGVAKYDNMVIFVPFTAVGDVCEIRITKVLSAYSFGRCEFRRYDHQLRCFEDIQIHL